MRGGLAVSVRVVGLCSEDSVEATPTAIDSNCQLRHLGCNGIR